MEDMLFYRIFFLVVCIVFMVFLYKTRNSEDNKEIKSIVKKVTRSNTHRVKLIIGFLCLFSYVTVDHARLGYINHMYFDLILFSASTVVLIVIAIWVIKYN